MKKKIGFTILLVIVLSLIGVGVYWYKSYNKTDDGKTAIYQKELGEILDLKGNKSVIKIIKQDINADTNPDYIALLGEEKYDDSDSSSSTLKKIGSNLEMYNNVSIEYISGDTKEPKRYDTKKSFGTDINMEIKENKYIIASDKTTGNIALTIVKDDNLYNIISESFGNEFNGYTINAEFDKENASLLKVKLDNYGRNYLKEKTEEYKLDFTDTIINKDNYRMTYMANNFCDFELNKVDENTNEYALVAKQYILYCNNNILQKNAGVVKTVFKFEGDKLVFSDVTVEK
ncbi:MAG: hypothetical protein PHP54_01240 [Clostridia bacterium]|nr:hypothetical protein [Clostridia bacterium]